MISVAQDKHMIPAERLTASVLKHYRQSIALGKTPAQVQKSCAKLLRAQLKLPSTLRALELAVDTAENEAQYWLEHEDVDAAKAYIRDRNVYHDALSNLVGTTPSPLRWRDWLRTAKDRRWYTLF